MSTPENKVELEEVVVLVAHWKPLDVFNGLGPRLGQPKAATLWV